VIRILLVDDQSLIRESLKLLLDLQADFEVVGEAEHGQQALDLVDQLKPDIILMDIRMPTMDGVEATKTIQDKFPKTKVLVLTTFDDDELVINALQAGAAGYFLKDTPSENLAIGIRSAYRGNSQFSSGVIDKLIKYVNSSEPTTYALPEGLNNLTKREKEVFYLLGTGADYKEISEVLFITEGTVKNYVNKISEQLDVKGRTRLALLAHELTQGAYLGTE
jgi:DNA-binding NarL/FixJ family response regulator